MQASKTRKLWKYKKAAFKIVVTMVTVPIASEHNIY